MRTVPADPSPAPAAFGALQVRRCDATTVSICGEVDVMTAPAIAAALADPDVTAVDLRNVTFIDAAGLRVLLDAHRRRTAGITLRSVSRPVQRLFEASGHGATFRATAYPVDGTASPCWPPGTHRLHAS